MDKYGIADSRDLERQWEYAKRLEEENFAFDLMIADAFVRGIRDIGYKSTATALDELIDNAIQAEAENIFVEFKYYGDSKAKPDEIAVLDDGHGMYPEMIPLSVIWGGTHREEDREGFGRYGYGLPSASVSQGRAFTVYSRVEGGPLHKVTVDVDEIGKKSPDYMKDGRIAVPEARPAELPAWLEGVVEKDFGDAGMTHGTVVVIERLEPNRLSQRTTTALERNLLQHFGTTYRNFLRGVNLWVNGKVVEPVDPLFTTPGYRFYDLDDDRAEALEPQVIDVKDRDSRGSLGEIKVRYSYMPPTFARVDKSKERGKNNARFSVIDENNGIVVMREGRQIDVVRGQRPYLTINNDDRYWGVELDFPATLDEEFSITTSKQRVALSDRIWEILREQGVLRAIAQLRGRYDEDKAKLKDARDRDEAQKRASAQAMEDAQKFKTSKPAENPERNKRSQERLKKEVERRSDASGMPPEQVQRQLEAEIQGNPYKVIQESLPGAPFFRVEQVGGQKVLYLNTAHRFYTDVYAGPESTSRLRATMEVLLFVLGENELDATEERQEFYVIERGVWSRDLHAALGRLEQIDSARDAELAISDAAERAEEQPA